MNKAWIFGQLPFDVTLSMQVCSVSMLAVDASLVPELTPTNCFELFNKNAVRRKNAQIKRYHNSLKITEKKSIKLQRKVAGACFEGLGDA